MTTLDNLRILGRPKVKHGRLMMGLTGWMDGGEVSTGTVAWLIRALGADRFAEIDPAPFYIYGFPGSMEMSALFRPESRIRDGLVTQLALPTSEFFAAPERNLILFRGREPNLRWESFAQCVFSVAREFEVRRIYFVGSFAGTVPHSREPRLYCSASSVALRDELVAGGMRASDYRGPASLITYMTYEAARQGLEMASVVAEIPAYVQGANPICIEAVVRRVARLLDVRIDLAALIAMRETFETKLDRAVERDPEAVEVVQKLESDYDNEIFDTQLGDLKDWLQKKGVTLE